MRPGSRKDALAMGYCGKPGRKAALKMIRKPSNNYRILVVDEEFTVCQALALGLTSEKFDVDTAMDGVSALDFACDGRYDVLVVDLTLPDIDGLEVIRRVKDLHPDTISILISAYSTKETILEAMRTEVSDYLEKPFQLSTIRLSISRSLERRESKLRMSL
jgi:DNA-binding NtrC family response regulator